MPTSRIYLAGPDVFAPDAKARFDRLRALCGQRGLLGLEPSDGDMATRPGPAEEIAARIYRSNIELIESAQGLLANLVAFRGTEPDSGTVFEIGYAVAKGLPVACVTERQSYAQRVRSACGVSPCGQFDASQGWMVEDFGLPQNLMLAVPCRMFDCEATALDWLGSQVGQRRAA